GFDALLLFAGAGVAVLADIYEIPDDAGPILTEGTKAFYVRNRFVGGGVSAVLYALDASSPAAILAADAVDVPGNDWATLAAVAGGYAFVQVGWPTTAVFDVTDPWMLDLIGRFLTEGWAGAELALRGGRAFLPSEHF